MVPGSPAGSLVYVTLLIVLFSSFDRAESKCVFRSNCDDFESLVGPLKIPCVVDKDNDTPRKITNETLIQSLQRVCPYLDPVKNPELCCDEDQIVQLTTQLATPQGMFGRCPSCFYNFANYACQMTCSPNQSKFIRVDQSERSKTYPEKDQLVKISYAIEESFVQTLFNSCANVLAPGPGAKPIGIMCGQWGDQCTAHRLLEYIGQKNPSPFSVNWEYFPDSNVTDIEPLHFQCSQCSEAPGVFNKSACSCSDCPAVCAPKPQPDADGKFVILGFDGMILLMSLVYMLISAVLLSYFAVHGNIQTPVQEGMDEIPLIEPAEQSKSPLEEFLEENFIRWGYIVTNWPILTILIGTFFILISSLPLVHISRRITSDPVELWSAPSSQARQEKNYFDSNFGPFYRTSQLIVKKTTREGNFNYTDSSGKSFSFGPIFKRDFLLQILEIQNEIAALTAQYNNQSIHLEDICFSPLVNGKCAVQSVIGYFQSNATRFEGAANYTYLDHIISCLANPYAPDDNLSPFHYPCLGEYGGPALPKVAFGGFSLEEAQKFAVQAYTQATSLVITFIINNHADKLLNGPAEAWEKVFIDYMHSFNYTRFPNLDISFFSERSIQDEIDRQSITDISTIVVSYLVMFGYVSLTLGKASRGSQMFVQSKVGLGLLGVMIVLASVASSIGLMILFGFNLTLIIMEVIPFLALAVGVDNIFILTQHLQRSNLEPDESYQDQVARVLGKCGPSILMAFLCEFTCFLIGGLTTMPAIRVFSLNAALALLIDFLLQISVFIAFLYLDLKRTSSSRLDIFCCFTTKTPETAQPEPENSENSGLLYVFFKDFYAPTIMQDKVRLTITLLYTFWICSSLATVNKIEVGLDQELSMPHDSYVLKYFKSQKHDLRVGPPVYFVAGGKFNYSDDYHQKIICGASFCHENSLFNQISQASHEPNSSYIVDTPASWLDDYIDWLRQRTCCMVFRSNTSQFCPSSLKIDRSKECKACDVSDEDDVIIPEKFTEFLPHYLNDTPTVTCPKGGKAAYGSAVKLNEKGLVAASHYSSYHSPLVSSADFIGALRSARFLASNIEKSVTSIEEADEEVTIFPYSLIYVYYEQYLTIYGDTVKSLTASIAAIFMVSFVLYGFDIRAALIVCLTIICIVINMMGMMYWFDIPLNALSLVNLVMAAGISVEFCSHIAHAYLLSNEPTRKARAQEALAEMGSSVLSGITLTKFAGILILAWSKSQIFVVFYFKMYFGIVLIGASHGLILLPVLLSLIGNQPKLTTES